ncbi:hypothetical protein NDY24_20995 [Xanthomonas hortorum pv. pelargonii]|nr:hypothetical protein NDY24_20995 [Xanthomonas hortorum pv. pelargonii]
MRLKNIAWRSRIVEIDELAHFINAEFASETTQLGQAAQHRHHVLIDQVGFLLPSASCVKSRVHPAGQSSTALRQRQPSVCDGSANR